MRRASPSSTRRKAPGQAGHAVLLVFLQAPGCSLSSRTCPDTSLQRFSPSEAASGASPAALSRSGYWGGARDQQGTHRPLPPPCPDPSVSRMARPGEGRPTGGAAVLRGPPDPLSSLRTSLLGDQGFPSPRDTALLQPVSGSVRPSGLGDHRARPHPLIPASSAHPRQVLGQQVLTGSVVQLGRVNAPGVWRSLGVIQMAQGSPASGASRVSWEDL